MAELGPALLLCFGQATRPELSVFHMGRERVQGDGRASTRDLGGVNQHVQCLEKKLGSMGSWDEGAGDALSCSFGMLACRVCTEELFCRVPTQENQVGEVQWESELLAPDYLLYSLP